MTFGKSKTWKLEVMASFRYVVSLTGALLLHQASATKQAGDRIAAKRWCDRGMVVLRDSEAYSKKANDEDRLLLMDRGMVVLRDIEA